MGVLYHLGFPNGKGYIGVTIRPIGVGKSTIGNIKRHYEEQENKQ